jgi:lipopolysaccharide transport system permease protein
MTDAMTTDVLIDSDVRPHLVIRPPKRWTPIDFGELWEFRDLLTRFVVRDLKLRYRQTALGVIWVVLQPLLAAGAFAFVFGKVAGLDSEGVPYFAFAYVGMLAWNLFSNAVTRMSGSLVGNAQLVSKIFFPRLVLPLSTLGSIIIDFGVALTMGVLVLAVAGVNTGWAVLTLPIWVVVVTLLASGIGLLAAALMVPYRDVQYMLPVATQLLLYASPIAYSLAAVPASARGWVQLNPLTGALEGFRWALLGVGDLRVGATAWTVSFSVVIFLLGAFVFNRMERRFADVI